MRALGQSALLACALCLWSACFFAPGARADAAQEDAARAATEHHDRGVRAFAAGRYRQAIELFRRADALKPSAAIAFNVASAYERLGERAAAASAYREYLRRAPDAKDARAVERKIRALQAPPQKVTIESSPPGASLWIDGKGMGPTPYAGQLEAGLHTLELQLVGHAPEVRVLEVSQDMNETVVIAMRESAVAAEPVVVATAPGTTPPRARVFVPEPAAPRAASPANPAPRSTREERERTSTVGVLGWVAMGGAVAAFGGALTLEIMRRAEEDRARRAQTQIGFHERVETMQAQQTAAIALAATGAGLTALGGVLLYVDATREEQREEKREAPGLSARLLLQRSAIGAQLRGVY
jgi:tetratricopeptide (TPR) repeat protein